MAFSFDISRHCHYGKVGFNKFLSHLRFTRVFPERHDITIAYLCMCKEGKTTLNDEHSEYALFNRDSDGLHPYIIEVIHDCNLKKIISETMKFWLVP